MAMTRSKSRASRTKKQIYRSRVKRSRCRGKSRKVCKAARGCATTKAGRRRSYCRKSRNRHV